MGTVEGPLVLVEKARRGREKEGEPRRGGEIEGERCWLAGQGIPTLCEDAGARMRLPMRVRTLGGALMLVERARRGGEREERGRRTRRM
eukprot:scaffold321138_cov33-Tisochrysis_lutea.AAC.1